jgi:hypothetical protein
VSTLSSATSQLQSQESTLIETPLASARPNSVTDSPTPDDMLDQFTKQITASGISNPDTTVGNSTGILSGFQNWLTNSSVNIVAVLIGLVLIAGAVWGFSTVRDTVVETAQGAATLAA